MTEIEVLRLCALRIDGYLWASHQGIDREELLQPFWHEEARAQLMEKSWDHQWASWFMQERTLRWSGANPDAGVLRLWRELFLSLASKRPSPPYDRGFAGDAQIQAEWDARFAPHVAELKNIVATRLARDVCSDVPLAGSVTGAGAVQSSLS
ncbi:MAG: hypothetical protein AB7T37_13560 [Dehalococcoidia bacterium]